jgi:hypothetical protein
MATRKRCGEKCVNLKEKGVKIFEYKRIYTKCTSKSLSKNKIFGTNFDDSESYRGFPCLESQ